MASSPASIKYGELFVLGYYGFPPNGDKVWRNRHFVLCQRTKANGVKLSTVHMGCNTQATKALSIRNLHRICYTTVSQMGQVSTAVVEYACDSNTDMFQIGRSKESPNDFVLTELPDSHSSISRFACRIVCQRNPPYAARIYAAGFDSAKNISLGQDAVKWKTQYGQMDGLTTNGVLVMHPLHGFTKDYEPSLWREISVCGNVFTVRETCSPQQRGWTMPGESQELVDGSLIDLCGVTLLWRTAEGLARMPTMGHLEVQCQEIYAMRPCFVYKAKKDGAGILKDLPNVSSVSHPCETIPPGIINRRIDHFIKRFPLQGRAVPRLRVPQDSQPAVLEAPARKVKEFLKHARKLTLDPNTAHVKISLSENNRKVTRVEGEQKYPDHADRFKDYGQVMCRDSLIGPCYWEVEWSGEVEIAVTYRGINRKGDESQFGYNAMSWSLKCSGDDNSYTAWHNKKKTDLLVSPSSCSGRAAVYVDHSSGTVSFYKVSSDTLTHLHSFQATFTEPLYAGFWVGWTESSVSAVFERQEVQ